MASATPNTTHATEATEATRRTSSNAAPSAVVRPVDALQTTLRDTFALYRRTHLAHFNVRGPDFPQLHALYESQYQELWDAVDTIGERIRALGELVEDDALAGATDHVSSDAKTTAKTLAAAHRDLSTSLKETARVCSASGDVATEDLCVGRIRAHDQHAWMLEAYGAA